MPEIRVRPHMTEHDVARKVAVARRCLERGDPVVLTVVFDYANAASATREEAEGVLRRVSDPLLDVAEVTEATEFRVQRMSLTLAPISIASISLVEDNP
jgi:translation initiation factor IF-3